MGEENKNILFPLPSILEGRSRGGGLCRTLSDQANCTAGGRGGGGGVLAGLLVVAGLGGAAVGGGGRARLLRHFLLCVLAGLLEVLAGVGARHLLCVLQGGAAGGGRVAVRIAARACGVPRS